MISAALLAVTAVGALPGVLAGLIGAAGIFYLFFSRAASRLAGIEETSANNRRQHLRRMNGVVMILLAIGIAGGSYAGDVEKPTAALLGVWLVVMALLVILLVLGLIDLRLSLNLRRSLRRHHERTP